MMSSNSNIKNQNIPTRVYKKMSGLSEFAPMVFSICFVIIIFSSAMASYAINFMNKSMDSQMEELRGIKQDDGMVVKLTDGGSTSDMGETAEASPAKMVEDMAKLYEQNEDVIGWLKIEGMNVDYPVMQTMEDEEYYLERDFEGNYNINGSLIMDTDSTVGTGTKAMDYADGTKPSTNLIIHGHNMKNGNMFGNLDKYRDIKFEKTHDMITFSSLYETRKYQIVSVFLSQVYRANQTDVFKYYKFFQADNEEEFYDFYDNIKKKALYDTGVEAKYGDEFITLSVCAYHVENGRLVVVGKRVE